MEIEFGFTDLLLTSHAGLPAFAQVLTALRLGAAFGPSLKTIPDADIFTTATALLALGKCDFAPGDPGQWGGLLDCGTMWATAMPRGDLPVRTAERYRT